MSGYIAVLFFSKISWTLFLNAVEAKKMWSTSSINIHNILQLVNGQAEEYKYITIKNFAERFFLNQGGDECFAGITWMIVIGIFFLVLYVLQSGEKKQIRILDNKFYILGIYTGIIGYALSLLLLYVFSFSDWEAVILASYDRYMNTLWLGLVVFLAMIMLQQEIPHKWWKNMLIVGAIGITSFSSYKNVVYFCSDYRLVLDNALMLREKYDNEDMKKFSDFMKPGIDKVYFINQDGDGISLFISAYNAAPIMIGAEPYCIGEKYKNVNKWWAAAWSVDEWTQRLENYTYVYLKNVDDEFREEYGTIFNDKISICGNTLFRIVKEENSIQLEMVE